MLAKWRKSSTLLLINEDTTMPPNTERITTGELPVGVATELVLDAVNRASSEAHSGHFRVAGGDAAGTIVVNRHPLTRGQEGRIRETHDYIEACVGPQDEVLDGFFWQEETVIGIDFSRTPGLTFKKGERVWAYGSEEPPKKFVVKALTRLGLDSIKL